MFGAALCPPLGGRVVPVATEVDAPGSTLPRLFLAANQLSSYYTGEVIAALGGETTPG